MSTPIEFKDIRPGDTVRRILTHEVKVVDREDHWLHSDAHQTLTDATTVFDVTWELVDRPVKELKPGTVVKNGSGTEWVVLEDGTAVRRSPTDGSWRDAAMTAEELAKAVAGGDAYAGPYVIVWEPSE